MSNECLGKPVRKKSDKKIEIVKIKMKLPHVNEKSQTRKRIFVQTPFSNSTYFEWKIFTPQKHSLFGSIPASA